MTCEPMEQAGCHRSPVLHIFQISSVDKFAAHLRFSLPCAELILLGLWISVCNSMMKCLLYWRQRLWVVAFLRLLVAEAGRQKQVYN